MADIFKRGVSTLKTGSTSLSLVTPPYTAEGDLMVMFFTHKGADWATVPAGWTLIARDISGATRGEAHWKRAAAGESGTYAVSDLASTACGYTISLGGCLPSSDPIDVVATRANASGDSGTAGVTTTTNKALVVSIAALGYNYALSAWTGASLPVDLVEMADGGTTTGTRSRIGWAHVALATAGATGETGWTSTAVENVGICFAIKPDPAEVSWPTPITSVTERTNLTAATAIDVASLPATLIEAVEGLPDSETVWFKYTPSAEETSFGLFAWTAVTASTYRPLTSVYYGTPASLTSVFTNHLLRPLCVPVIEGETYYIKVHNQGASPVAATLVVSFVLGPNETVPIGSLVMPDDRAPWPAVCQSAVDGEILRVLSYPGCDAADILDSGVNLAEVDGDGDRLDLYSSSLEFVSSVLGVVSSTEWPTPRIRGDGTTNFYVCQQEGDLLVPPTVYTVSSAGVVGATTWTLPANAINLPCMAPSRDGTILYYGAQYLGGTTAAVHRYDLVADAPLTDLAAGISGHDLNTDILVMEDGSILVGYRHTTTPYNWFARRYAPDGTVLNTYDQGAVTLHRLALGPGDGTFWVWLLPLVNTVMMSRHIQIRASDGVELVTFDTPLFSRCQGRYSEDPEPDRFGVPHTCPIFVLRSEIEPPTPAPPPIAPLVFSRYQTRRLRRSPHIASEQRRLIHSRFQLDVEAGVGQTEEGSTLDPNEDPYVYLRWSDDGGHTWSQPIGMSAGKLGEYKKRLIWNRLGDARSRVFEVSMSAPVKWALLDAFIETAG
jgi:hypothetical protein